MHFSTFLKIHLKCGIQFDNQVSGVKAPDYILCISLNYSFFFIAFIDEEIFSQSALTCTAVVVCLSAVNGPTTRSDAGVFLSLFMTYIFQNAPHFAEVWAVRTRGPFLSCAAADFQLKWSNSMRVIAREEEDLMMERPDEQIRVCACYCCCDLIINR